MLSSKHEQIQKAFQNIIAEASKPTPSGFHKLFVVGQLVVNIKEDRPAAPCKEDPDFCEACSPRGKARGTARGLLWILMGIFQYLRPRPSNEKCLKMEQEESPET